jgi:hypothetical protein
MSVKANRETQRVVIVSETAWLGRNMGAIGEMTVERGYAKALGAGINAGILMSGATDSEGNLLEISFFPRKLEPQAPVLSDLITRIESLPQANIPDADSPHVSLERVLEILRGESAKPVGCLQIQVGTLPDRNICLTCRETIIYRKAEGWFHVEIQELLENTAMVPCAPGGPSPRIGIRRTDCELVCLTCKGNVEYKPELGFRHVESQAAEARAG